MHRVTPFQHRVYEACSRIPAGKVTTYKSLAEAVQCRSAQAVGQALKRNPFAPDVPCHRVVRSDLKLGGYSGKTRGRQTKRKRALLESEGVAFVGSDRISDECLFRFPGT